MPYISYCGLLCEECPIYIATITGDEAAKAKLAVECSGHTIFTAEDMNCLGCFSEKRSIKMCCDCEIRNCAVQKEIKNCGECCEYPCKAFEAHIPPDSENRLRLDKIRSKLKAAD